jgi:hypothetical protein
VRFIAEHNDRAKGGVRWGVEPICAVLREQGCKIAPSSYYDAAGRVPSAMTRRDQQLKAAITRVRADNYSVYGARRGRLALNREGRPVRADHDRYPGPTPELDHAGCALNNEFIGGSRLASRVG